MALASSRVDALDCRCDQLFAGQDGVHEVLRVGFVHRDRFFDQHMQPRLQRRDPERRVIKMRRRDQYGIHVPRRNEVFARKEPLHIGPGFEPFRVGISHRREHSPFDFALLQCARMVRPHVAHANDANAHFVHSGAKN